MERFLQKLMLLFEDLNHLGHFLQYLNSLPASKIDAGCAGPSTASVAMGGGPSPTNTSFEWDGTNWTAGGTMITAIQGNASGGTQTAAFSAGGYVGPAATVKTETYNGTSFATAPSLATARNGFSGSGTTALGLVYGGYSTTYSNSTEEFTGETTALNIKTITTG